MANIHQILNYGDLLCSTILGFLNNIAIPLQVFCQLFLSGQSN